MRIARGYGETQEVAEEVVKKIAPGETARIIALSGDLGAGKTVFAQAFARALGVSEAVTSPTFIVERRYVLQSEKGKGFARLIHVDAYRLQGAHELEALGWKETAADPLNLILIEWPERVASLIPTDAVRIAFSYVDELTRTIQYEH